MTFNLEIFYPLCSVVLEIGLLTEILFIICEVMFKKKKKVFKMEKEFGDYVNHNVVKREILGETYERFGYARKKNAPRRF